MFMEENMEKEAREYIRRFFVSMEKDTRVDVQDREKLKEYLSAMKENIREYIKKLGYQSISINEYKHRRSMQLRRIKLLEEAERIFDEEYDEFIKEVEFKQDTKNTIHQIKQEGENLRQRLHEFVKPIDSKKILEDIQEKAKQNIANENSKKEKEI